MLEDMLLIRFTRTHHDLDHGYLHFSCIRIVCPDCVSIMELPLRSVSDCELRSVIRFLTAKKLNGVQIHKELESVYGEKCMSVPMVYRWMDISKCNILDPHGE